MVREKKKRESQPAADLNVALIKMACTRGEEEYEPRNVLFPSIFPPRFSHLSCSNRSDFYCSQFASLASPSSIFPLCPHPHLFSLCLQSPLSLFFSSSFYFLSISEEAQCLCMKVRTGGCLQPAREKSTEMKRCNK